MEKVILSTENYRVYEATEDCLMELSEFIVSENYRHHSSEKVHRFIIWHQTPCLCIHQKVAYWSFTTDIRL